MWGGLSSTTTSGFERIVWMNDSVNHSLDKGTYHHLLAIFVSYLFNHDRPKPAKVQAWKHIRQNIA